MKTVNLNIRMNEEIRDKFKGIAEDNAQTPSILVRKWIEEYIKENENKGAIEMKNIIKQITEGYKVDGENEKYIEFYESYEAIEQEGALSKIEASLDIGQTVEGLQYPVIFFDDSNADSGQLYEASQVDDVLDAASEYFEAK